MDGLYYYFSFFLSSFPSPSLSVCLLCLFYLLIRLICFILSDLSTCSICLQKGKEGFALVYVSGVCSAI